MSSAYWMDIRKSYGDLFYTPKSLPCCQKNILLIALLSKENLLIALLSEEKFANSPTVKKKILLIALLSNENLLIAFLSE